MKVADIIPVLENGCRADCGVYRGIALLSISRKILVCILLNIVKEYIYPKYLICCLMWFLQRLMLCKHDLLSSSISRKIHAYVCREFLVFTKPFDTVSHSGFGWFLRILGCPRRSINLFTFLHEGMQAAQNSNNSSWFVATEGVNQGCILAPAAYLEVYLWKLEGRFTSRRNMMLICSTLRRLKQRRT